MYTAAPTTLPRVDAAKSIGQVQSDQLVPVPFYGHFRGRSRPLIDGTPSSDDDHDLSCPIDDHEEGWPKTDLKTRERVTSASVDVESQTRQDSTWPRARSPRAGSPKPEELSPTFDGIDCDGSLGDAVSDYPMSDGGGDTSADHLGDTAVASNPETVPEQLGSFTAHGKFRRQSARLASRESAPSEWRSPPMKRATIGHAVLHGPPNPRSTSDFLRGFMPWLGSKGLRGCEEPNEHAAHLLFTLPSSSSLSAPSSASSSSAPPSSSSSSSSTTPPPSPQRPLYDVNTSRSNDRNTVAGHCGR
jgi:hypothetical protein